MAGFYLRSQQTSTGIEKIASREKRANNDCAHMRSFKELFCEHFSCLPENYKREAMNMCIYPHAAPFLNLLLFLEPRMIADGFELLEEAGQAKTDDEFEEAISEYAYRRRFHGGFVFEILRLRISCQRLLNIYQVLRDTSGRQLDLIADTRLNIIPLPRLGEPKENIERISAR